MSNAHRVPPRYRVAWWATQFSLLTIVAPGELSPVHLSDLLYARFGESVDTYSIRVTADLLQGIAVAFLFSLPALLSPASTPLCAGFIAMFGISTLWSVRQIADRGCEFPGCEILILLPFVELGFLSTVVLVATWVYRRRSFSFPVLIAIDAAAVAVMIFRVGSVYTALRAGALMTDDLQQFAYLSVWSAADENARGCFRGTEVTIPLLEEPAEVRAALSDKTLQQWNDLCDTLPRQTPDYDPLLRTKANLCIAVGALHFNEPRYCAKLSPEPIIHTSPFTAESLITLCLTALAAKSADPQVCALAFQGSRSYCIQRSQHIAQACVPPGIGLPSVVCALQG